MSREREQVLEPCEVCGERHQPNGSEIGAVAGVPIIINCRIDPEIFPNGVLGDWSEVANGN